MVGGSEQGLTVGLFSLIPGADKLKKKVEADLSAKLGRDIVLPTPSNMNVLLGATSGALTLLGAASAFVPGVGPLVGAALAAGGKAVAALQSGDSKGAALAALGVLGPAVGDTAARTLAPLVGDVLTTAKAIEDSWKGVAVSAGAVLPGLKSLVGDKLNADGLRVLADKALSAQALPGELGARANAVINETKKLASAGNAQAQAALQVLGEVSAKRATLKLGAGVEQTVSAAGCKALAAQLSYAAAPKTAAVGAELEKATANKAAADKDAAQTRGAWNALAVKKTAADAQAAADQARADARAAGKVLERAAIAKKNAAELAASTAAATAKKAAADAQAAADRARAKVAAAANAAAAAAAAAKAAAAKAQAQAAATAAAKTASATAAAALASSPAGAAYLAAKAAAPAACIGFVVTAAGRVLDGTRWTANGTGVDGVLVRATGPLALRRDSTVRRWKRT
jgi:hypothetical protein